MAPEPALLTAIHILQNPIPQYVLGTLPAIAIMGTTPHDKLSSKLSWYYGVLDVHSQDCFISAISKKILENWVAEATLLDRLASLVFAYYILVGIFAGISKAAGPCMEDNSLEDWPFIPLLFIWTLPIIYVRIKNRKVVDRMELDQINEIPINNLEDGLYDKQKHVALTALASVTLPWLA
ncbi:3535_t:CDS:2, partial [Gigaspora margarita]